MQLTDDVAYKLSNLVELIIWCRSPVFTFFEQYSYLVQCSMYNPSDIDNTDYVLIISFSKLLCKREDLTVTSTVNPHISSTVLYARL